MYCGDETGSFIGEIGSHSCKFGYGGEDNPKYVVPPYVDQGGGGASGRSSTRPSSTLLSSSLSLPHAYRQQLKQVEEAAAASTKKAKRGRKKQKATTTLTNPLITEFPDDDGVTSILRVAAAQSSNDMTMTPITDPHAFLKQGDVVEHWNALETAWQQGLHVLHAKDSHKHTTGRRRASDDDTIDHHQDHGGGCVHPLLAIVPGISHSLPSEEGSTTTTGRQYAKAVHREQYLKYTELAMEQLQASSFFLAPAPMVAAFSMGRQTALVVDIGASGTKVTPVVDGLLLKQSQRRNGRGGDWLTHCLWQGWIDEMEHETSSLSSLPEPPYLRRLTSTKKLQPGKGLFHRWAVQDEFYQLRSEPWVQLDAWRNPAVANQVPFLHADTNDDNDSLRPPTPITPGSMATTSTAGASSHALPDGTAVDLTTSFGRDVTRLPELLFAESLPFSTTAAAAAPVAVFPHATVGDASLPQLIRQSLLSVGDVDARKELASNICLVGGSSLIPNMESRLSYELTHFALPHCAGKPKVLAPRHAVERSCASWIGASVLTSLGSFQQLWLSRAEYEEYGTSLAIQRFPS